MQFTNLKENNEKLIEKIIINVWDFVNCNINVK